MSQNLVRQCKSSVAMSSANDEQSISLHLGKTISEFFKLDEKSNFIHFQLCNFYKKSGPSEIILTTNFVLKVQNLSFLSY